MKNSFINIAVSRDEKIKIETEAIIVHKTSVSDFCRRKILATDTVLPDKQISDLTIEIERLKAENEELKNELNNFKPEVGADEDGYKRGLEILYASIDNHEEKLADQANEIKTLSEELAALKEKTSIDNPILIAPTENKEDNLTTEEVENIEFPELVGVTGFKRRSMKRRLQNKE